MMKLSIRKLRELTATHHQKNDPKEKRRRNPKSLVDELSQATQDMHDMRDCYEGLLSAANATASSAYEFSEALEEFGTCLLQKTALHDDEESGKVLLMIGRAQFELRRFVDNYRSHIFQTITTPSESLLNELQAVEEIKRQCDEKREILNHMLDLHKEKGKPRSSKGRHVLSHELQEAEEAYEEEAAFVVFRLNSLKQGQSRSLLTQATRHHAAQLNFFQKGNKSLDAIEPHIKSIAEQRHIDYQFSSLEDDVSEDDDDYSYENNDCELRVDYDQTEDGPDGNSASRSPMELDEMNRSAPISHAEQIKENTERKHSASLSLNRAVRNGSYSAPIFPNKKIDFSEKIKEFQSSKKFYPCVLPTPAGSESAKLASSAAVNATSLASKSEKPSQLWHSSPLKLEKSVRGSGAANISASPLPSAPRMMLKEDKKPVQRPPQLPEHFSSPKFHVDFTDVEKMNRQAFSGPLTNKAWTSKIISPNLTEYPTVTPGLNVHGFKRQSSSRKVSFSPSQSPMRSPKINELHELPRPPLPSSRPTRPLNMIGYSAPLVPRSSEGSPARKLPSISEKASPLPMPPGTITRSFSIPSISARIDLSAASRLSEAQCSDMSDGIGSPTLSPICLTNSQSVSNVIPS